MDHDPCSGSQGSPGVAGVQDSPPAPADLAHPQQGGRAQQTAQHFGRTWI